jgi:squalene-hopene/tetraprenyl-beta-curcumene cyclase
MKPKPPSWRGRLFNGIDKVLRQYQKRPLSNLRERALGEAERWIVKRQEADGSWGGIQPPWVYSLMALSLRGYTMDHPVMRAGMKGLDAFTVHEGDERRLEACQSPVWDTAYAIQALADAGVAPTHQSLVKGVDWLLTQEVRVKGDWTVRRPDLTPSGWAFEFANVNYPDIDDTAEVVLALRRVLHPNPQAVESAVARSVRWMIGMRSKNGGWGAFDADNVRALCRDIPFCDFGEVIDPPTADVTAHVIEALAKEGLDQHPVTMRGTEWLLQAQEKDGSWFGRWGVNYVYGTGASLMALAENGAKSGDPAVRRAVKWLESHQNKDGGWGEDVRSYDDPKWAGVGDSTASQTAWALLGLIAFGERSTALERGIAYLIETQKSDGRWDEPQFTGTGFPGDFYINYHLYRQVFPMMALGRYAAMLAGKPVGILPLRDYSLVQIRTQKAS